MNTSDDLIFEKYYNYSLRFLSYRPRSEKELKDKLKFKKVEPLIIEQIIIKLKEQNFLNDEEFTKWWIEQRTTFKVQGLNLIKLELMQKGIQKEVIENQISKILAEQDPALQDKSSILNERENAKKLIERKMERLKDLPRQEVYQKIGSFLARRGFDMDTIHSLIDEFYKKGV